MLGWFYALSLLFWRPLISDGRSERQYSVEDFNQVPVCERCLFSFLTFQGTSTHSVPLYLCVKLRCASVVPQSYLISSKPWMVDEFRCLSQYPWIISPFPVWGLDVERISWLLLHGSDFCGPFTKRYHSHFWYFGQTHCGCYPTSQVVSPDLRNHIQLWAELELTSDAYKTKTTSTQWLPPCASLKSWPASPGIPSPTRVAQISFMEVKCSSWAEVSMGTPVLCWLWGCSPLAIETITFILVAFGCLNMRAKTKSMWDSSAGLTGNLHLWVQSRRAESKPPVS